MILPEYRGKRFSYWNTNSWALNMARPAPLTEPSEFLVTERKERLSEYARRILNADVLYGGWMEDRSFLWRGSYMEPSLFRHLGTDFVVPALSIVQLDEPAVLVQEYRDPPGDSHGWGTRLMFRLVNYPDIHLVYGHLEPDTMGDEDIGRTFEAGEFIGFIGRPEVNGGWSSHLHVQAIFGDVTEFLENPASLDGYGELHDLETLSRRFPDPLPYISIR